MSRLADAEVGSPVWWRDRLLKKLDERSKRVAVLENYYDGSHPLPQPPQAMQRFQEAVNAFSNLSRLGVTNYVKLVADAPAERLRVTGFRFGEPENFKDDKDAWRIWQRNHLDADSGPLQHKALVTGQSFALVWPDADRRAEITVEHPSQAIVAYVPGSHRRRAAGLKAWVEDDGSSRCVLYLSEQVFKWQAKAADAGPTDWKQWAPKTDDTWPIKNPFNRPSLVELRANADLRPAEFGGGHGEFEAVLAIQDRINKTVFDRLVTAEFQAFRQRWAVGWTPDNANEAIKASVSRLMSFEDSDVTVGEFAQADFTGFIKSVESDVTAMAAITRTPSFYTLGSISNISGDTLKALQGGLTAKTEGHRDNFSEDYEEIMSLALLAEGNARGGDEMTETVWRDIEHRTWAETADAVLKMQSLGVPRDALWEMLPNVSPQMVERWKIMAAEEALAAVDVEEDNQRDLNLVEQVQKIYLGVGSVLTTEEARAILNRSGAGLTGPGPSPEDRRPVAR